ncbi:MAG: glycosyltransferase family 2 protein [Leptospiraceae bacterium]|nr:glycosyltransferase family 2 protein [Leptospiraceae bacterium]
MDPAVLIVIPCFNDGAFLRESVASAQNQDYPGIEIVVVDDGSTDPGTQEVMKRLSEEGVQVLHKRNGHLSSARNHGIASRKTDFVFPLDADDRIESTFIRKGVAILKTKPEVGVVTSHIRTFGNLDELWKPMGGGIENVIGHNNAACGNSLFRRLCWEQVGGYDESMVHGQEDWEFWVNVLKRGWMVEVIPEELFFYRISSKSMAINSKPYFVKNLEYIIRKHREVFQEHIETAILYREQRIQDMDRALDRFRKLRSHPIMRLAYRLGLKKFLNGP